MNKYKFIIILTSLLTIVLAIYSCNQERTVNQQDKNITENDQDTTIVKHKNVLNKSYEVDFYSKSYSYYWLTGKDTLDFMMKATEHKKDSTLQISVHHKSPILFSTILKRINDCYAVIEKDFQISKLNSLYIKEPIFYPDLAQELSIEYEHQFGRKNISYEKLSKFLLNTALNTQLNNAVNPLGKKIKGYSIEKFHIMEKKFYHYYLPETDTATYPEFTIHGMGIYIQLENK